MKKIKQFVARQIADEIVLVPIGETAQNFNGIISLNPVAEFIWEHIEQANNFAHLIRLILAEYEVDTLTAVNDANEFINQLLAQQMIELSNETW